MRRIGQETASVLIEANNQRDAITRAAEEEAQRLVADATVRATTITGESEARVRELEGRCEVAHHRRDRLLETALAASAAIADIVHEAHRQIPPIAAPEIVELGGDSAQTIEAAALSPTAGQAFSG